MKNLTGANAQIVKVIDYERTFNLSTPTARKHYREDCINTARLLGTYPVVRRRLTRTDVIRLYGNIQISKGFTPTKPKNTKKDQSKPKAGFAAVKKSANI